jgi:hypothetical protein
MIFFGLNGGKEAKRTGASWSADEICLLSIAGVRRQAVECRRWPTRDETAVRGEESEA